MNRVFKTLVVPSAQQLIINALAAACGPATLSCAWTAPAGIGGAETHQVTSGLLSQQFVQALTSAPALQAALSQVAELSLGDAQATLAAIDLSGEDADVALARMGLTLLMSAQGASA